MFRLRFSIKENKEWRGEFIHQMMIDNLNIKFFLGESGNTFVISAYLEDEENKIADINIKYKPSLSSEEIKSYAVTWIGVNENFRGKKIASKLYSLAVEESKKRGGTRFFSDEEKKQSPDSKKIWKYWQEKGIPIFNLGKRLYFDIK